MIVKSLSRKEPSFKSLIDYFNKNNLDDNLTIGRNLYNLNDKSQIIIDFMENSSNLKNIKN